MIRRIIVESKPIPNREELMEKKNKELIEKYKKRVKHHRTPEQRMELIRQYRKRKNVERD